MSSLHGTDISVSVGSVIVNDISIVEAADNIVALEIDFKTKYPDFVGITLGNGRYFGPTPVPKTFECHLGLIFGITDETLYINEELRDKDTEVSFRFFVDKTPESFWYLFASSVSRYTASICLVKHLPHLNANGSTTC